MFVHVIFNSNCALLIMFVCIGNPLSSSVSVYVCSVSLDFTHKKSNVLYGMCCRIELFANLSETVTCTQHHLSKLCFRSAKRGRVC